MLWDFCSMLRKAGMLPPGSSFALLCMVLCKIVGNDTDSSEDPVADFRYQIALKFFKTPILGQSLTWTSIQSPQTCVLTLRQGLGNNRPTKHSANQGSELGCGGSVCANLVVSSAFLSFFPCPFPTSGSEVYEHCQSLRFCEITVLYGLRSALRLVPGECCKNVKHPYGWPYHWERNLKSDPFAWLPESHCCIIHDSLLFFGRLILLPSPFHPHTAFIIWILYSELNHTALCSGQ